MFSVCVNCLKWTTQKIEAVVTVKFGGFVVVSSKGSDILFFVKMVFCGLVVIVLLFNVLVFCCGLVVIVSSYNICFS